jgi:alpha-tubulin suppressor-like RCC1 family protein
MKKFILILLILTFLISTPALTIGLHVADNSDEYLLVENISDTFSTGTVASGGSVATISAGGVVHSLVIKLDGSLWAWGANYYGQLGDGTTTDRLTPVNIQPGTTWKAVSAHDWCTFAIQTDGSLWAWGANYNGQLGDGTRTDRHTPVQIQPGTTWQSITTSGMFHSLGIKTDGSLWAWGWNNYGQLGDETIRHSFTPTEIQPGTTWQSISAGRTHAVGMKTDGSLWVWGGNEYGQLGTDTNQMNSLIPVKIMDEVVAVSVGMHHTMVIKPDKSLWAWGRNDVGQLGDGTTINRNIPVKIADDVLAISVYNNQSTAIRTGGSLLAWGGVLY